MNKPANPSKPSAPSPSPTDDQQITSYKIHPGLGIARIGNSPTEFYVGPLSPGEVPARKADLKTAWAALSGRQRSSAFLDTTKMVSR